MSASRLRLSSLNTHSASISSGALGKMGYASRSVMRKSPVTLPPRTSSSGYVTLQESGPSAVTVAIGPEP